MVFQSSSYPLIWKKKGDIKFKVISFCPLDGVILKNYEALFLTWRKASTLILFEHVINPS